MLYEQTKTVSEGAREQARAAYDKSLAIYTEAVSLALPNVDVTNLNEASNNIKEEVRPALLLCHVISCQPSCLVPFQAKQIKQSASEVLEQHYDLLDDVERQKHEAEEMLENGIRQQQVLCVMSAVPFLLFGCSSLHQNEM